MICGPAIQKKELQFITNNIVKTYITLKQFSSEILKNNSNEFAFPGQKEPRTLIPSLRRMGNGVFNNLLSLSPLIDNLLFFLDLDIS